MALLFAQAWVGAYACPILIAGAPVGTYAIAAPDGSHAATNRGCEVPLRNIGTAKLCHQHYAGDLFGSAVNVAFAPPASNAPVAVLGGPATVLPTWDATVLRVNIDLRRATGPSLSTRFQVLRI